MKLSFMSFKTIVFTSQSYITCSVKYTDFIKKQTFCKKTDHFRTYFGPKVRIRTFPGFPDLIGSTVNDLEYKTKFTVSAMNYVASYKCFQQLHKLQRYDYSSILAKNRGK